MSPIFFEQVKLLVSILPLIGKESCFALKGGTAINLFVRDLPRLSVDIDLTYTPVHDREKSLQEITAALLRIKQYIEEIFPDIEVITNRLQGAETSTRLILKRSGIQIKIEVSPVLRGCVHKPALRSISPEAESVFGTAEMVCLAMEDLYGGKICAALDRQHPRDLFDVHLLLENEGITVAMKNTFMVYLLSHPRPAAELLEPRWKDIGALYQQEFAGMTTMPMSLEKLLETRHLLLEKLFSLLDAKDREFLLSFKRLAPKWELFAYPKAAQLPAIRWKMHNLQKMHPQKRAKAVVKLEKVLQKGNVL
ncbi:hypothetical protein NNO_1522 [Hydrogenimonas sp.]|nr:hypothetical protein NNO_1522 [Hydrogenimonas sp.]